MKNTVIMLLFVVVCASACGARTNPYTPGSDQATLWDAIEQNCLVWKGPPAQLSWTSSGQMHSALRGIAAAMNGRSDAVQIDNYPTDDAQPAVVKVLWSNKTVKSSAVDIVISTTANKLDATPAAADAIIGRGESSAYADGGDYSTVGGGIFNGGAATATATAPMCLACAIGGQTTGTSGPPNSCSTGGEAAASTSGSESSAIAQGGDESTRGGNATASSSGTDSHATAFGGNSTKRYLKATPTPHFVGHKGGNATAQSTATSIARGGNGAKSEGTGHKSGDGGDATINGAAGSITEICNGGDPGSATKRSTPGAQGSATINQ